MSRISELSVQNVRCFASNQQARLGRITLLVGENNSGKSTFLGCYNAFANLSNLVDLDQSNPFDVSPFFMGDFGTISRSGTSGFTMAGQYENHLHSAARFEFGFNDGRQPFERDVAFTFPGKETSSASIRMSISDARSKDRMRLLFQGPDFTFGMDWAEISYSPVSTWLSRNVRHGILPYDASTETLRKRRNLPSKSNELVQFAKFVNFFRSEMPLPTSRGFNINALEPRLSARGRMYRETSDYLSDPEVRDRISHVGRKLGLWDNVDVNKVRSGDDTEIAVTLADRTCNSVDAGYGVHALLPLVHAIAAVDQPGIFLLQQPEIHLHPTAQAKLAQYMAEGPHDFLIETHSDHLVDRFRLCVMEQILQPEELSILYFERSKDRNESRICNIPVDSQGNIVNPPDSYREFFLTETERLLGIQ